MRVSGAKVFGMEAAELTMPDGRVVTVPIREDCSVYVPCWFGQPTPAPGSCPGYRLFLVIDGRMYRDVAGLVYLDEAGRRHDALKE